MLSVPQVDGMSPATISLVVIIVGTLIAFMALPHVRDKIKGHVQEPKDYITGQDSTAVQTSKDESASSDNKDDSQSQVERRREMDDFDLSIFKD